MKTYSGRLAVLSATMLLLAGCATTEHAQEMEQRLARLESGLKDVSARADAAMERAQKSELRLEGRVTHELVLTDDKLMFPANSSDLGGKDVTALNDLAAGLRSEGGSYAVEIQGHTDDSGNPEFNHQLGAGRADAVRRYLHLQGGIPLHRITAISRGASQPLPGHADSKEGNRRIVVRVIR